MTDPPNVSESITKLLFDKWTIENPPELKKDKIDFVGFSYHPSERFKQAKEIVIEIDSPSGTADPNSLGLTTIDDLFKIDIWIKVKDSMREARVRAENYRAILRKEIMDILHKNQIAIPGLKISNFDNFLKRDELENNLLHNIIYLKGEWYHYNYE
ncbi:MAG: hypothetical protein HZC29_01195 [Thaumarchaeota archaeon]|nr:hypothetical protein [Nitrososphaerota archaeon]